MCSSIEIKLKIYKEIINIVSSMKDETILVCNYVIADYIMGCNNFHVKPIILEHSNTPSPMLLSIGYFSDNEVFIDYNMCDSDFRIIARYTTKTTRKLKLENILDNKLNEMEKSIDLSKYIN